MGFNYPELESIETKMANDATGMTNWQTNTNNLIADNVGNPEVWSAASSCNFAARWDDFSGENFPKYKKEFEDANMVVNETIRSYKKAEDAN